jgi:amidophosphoribosyltransferase
MFFYYTPLRHIRHEYLLLVDSLGYLKLERLPELTGGRQFCQGCFTGKWPIDPPKEDIRGEYDA